ncbi:hypothetical protein [Streptomyces lavendulae]|uniref:hypothetical protein n=1 Tax=Streptomyces lavendulae TaxID=1914 RepID=UPI0024A2D0DC|nr:hypothetical protein [Streptomyces lavendulae]GLX22476.1 hypothetical protein Slala01_61200 [Streptomyces lavendulae subsp. lavendulae]GLX29959.1 hypothetical protein Slala02_57790 [Streptomyces lavendulae subsp. lavendulae]
MSVIIALDGTSAEGRAVIASPIVPARAMRAVGQSGELVRAARRGAETSPFNSFESGKAVRSTRRWQAVGHTRAAST